MQIRPLKRKQRGPKMENYSLIVTKELKDKKPFYRRLCSNSEINTQLLDDVRYSQDSVCLSGYQFSFIADFNSNEEIIKDLERKSEIKAQSINIGYGFIAI